MKKTLRFSAVFLCVIIFASLLFIAARHSNQAYTTPKAPISASFVPPESATDPTAVLIVLPENHNSDEVILYFGDELGRFNVPIGTFEVTGNEVTCKLSDELSCPENATKLWAFTVNEKAISDSGCSMDLSYSASPIVSDDSDNDTNVEKYAVIAIAAALVISFAGYAWLGKKKPEDATKTEDKEE